MSAHITPEELSQILQQKHAPTGQQAKVIEAPMQPTLVVAGAGAGKTETMAARVVWLVANRLVHPDRVLGLTFTRKAAQQLSARIRGRLQQLATSPRIADIDPTGELRDVIATSMPNVRTYDSFAGNLVKEFGLLAPVEPSSRMIGATELHQIISDYVHNYRGSFEADVQESTAVGYVTKLLNEMQNHMVSVEQVREESTVFIDEILAISGDKVTTYAQKWIDAQRRRIELLPIVEAVQEHLAQHHLMTFGEQMSIAAKVASEHPQVADALNKRYGVVLLDEYQDTSHAQRVLLSSLFRGSAITAVGDPMQSIYGWRGATAANLQRFLDDFATAEVTVEKKELTTSWRNPEEVLALANAVSATLLDNPDSDAPRLVSELEPRAGAAPGQVELGLFENAEAEVEFVAERFAQAFHGWDSEEPFTGAVLVRQRKHFRAIQEALEARGVPVEIVGLSGLLDIPEVADLNAIASLLIEPSDNQSALRVLTGPLVSLGVTDVLALHERALNLAGRTTTRVEPAEDPMERLQQIIAEVRQEATATNDTLVGLGDALADLGEPERYSPDGYIRLKQLASKLRYLRTHSLHSALPELYADIERVMGIRTEVLSRANPLADGVAGTKHLDRFAEEVANYARTPGASLQSMLQYFELAKDEEKGLSPAEVTVHSERVQLLTIHASKGLEWQMVAVLHADDQTYGVRTKTWVSNAEALPSALRGDAIADDNPNGYPVFEPDCDIEKISQFKKSVDAHMAAIKDVEAQEIVRLFYVAMTRAESSLLVTASLDMNTRQKGAYPPFVDLKEGVEQGRFSQKGLGEGNIVHWCDPAADKAADDAAGRATPDGQAAGHPTTPQQQVPTFPQQVSVRGVERVIEAIDSLPALEQDGELFERWEHEVTALLEEHEHASTPVVEVPLSRELTASDMVAKASNPVQFARRQRRPVPFKPNSFAKRGTQFHLWLEQRFGGPMLIEDGDLPGMDEPDADVSALQEAFLQSPWADRTPTYVEHGFEFALGAVVLRGRMDAVFDEGDGRWLIVDWKTGQPPQDAADKRAVQMQLAVYRLAWARLKGIDPEQVGAAFYYVRYGRLVQPQDLPGEQDLLAMLEQ